jgi:hypothetical protein
VWILAKTQTQAVNPPLQTRATIHFSFSNVISPFVQSSIALKPQLFLPTAFPSLDAPSLPVISQRHKCPDRLHSSLSNSTLNIPRPEVKVLDNIAQSAQLPRHSEANGIAVALFIYIDPARAQPACFSGYDLI